MLLLQWENKSNGSFGNAAVVAGDLGVCLGIALGLGGIGGGLAVQLAANKYQS